MLTELRIQNFAIIDKLELRPGEGLTILTGETGAGKSMSVPYSRARTCWKIPAT
jgi:DNA repair protein RecN (Recombination protein N)